jgi:hypothetical protein
MAELFVATPVLPPMSDAMSLACRSGDTQALVRLFRAGQSFNCVNESGGFTPLMIVLSYGFGIAPVTALIERGVDLTILSSCGANVLHYASAGGQLECVDLMLAITAFGINSKSNNGSTPICSALLQGHYGMVKHLMTKGADLFARLEDNFTQPLDVPVHKYPNLFLGPRALHHAKYLKWKAVKPLLLVFSRIFETSSSQGTANQPQPQPPLLLVSVLSNLDLVRVIATFFLPNIITRDQLEPEIDEVRERIEAELGAGAS